MAPHVLLDQDLCYRALTGRDARFDGRFFVCVKTTRIYCRPVCPARTPKRENCIFVPSAAAAEALGYRSCLRCRPETAPGTPAWAGSEASVARALRLIEEGALDEGSVELLATRLGIGARQLHRLFVRHLGASPQAVASNRRLLVAKQLITETELPLSEVATAAGFQSLRRFNDAVRTVYKRSPSELRRGSKVTEAQASAAICLRLGYRPPFDWNRMLAYLSGRAIPGVEEVTEETYRRTYRLGDSTGTIEVANQPARNALSVRIEGAGPLPVRQIVARVRRLFDLDADPAAITAALGGDPIIGPRLTRARGIRVPGAFDPFELAIRAVLGQQVSVKGATTLSGRVVQRCGTPLAAARNGLTHLFPTPEALAQADLSALGLTTGRAQTLKGLAAACASGACELKPGTSLNTSVAQLVTLPGIGEWTAHYVALRALGEPDAFPTADLGLRKVAGGGVPIAPRLLEQMAEAWRPWRGYAALLLWTEPMLDPAVSSAA
ncbi:AlkA N-terminal domain-containing protein [Hyalangium rubrum]|uniref:DNA-3-methyladenine glycosylase II n=1 Tax=Hyalangium rubrum TaxID=3103134 RepID=A0ABU5HAY0_9BACT|nr:AlkA N-terminal domain-containing protein [Hyalangium sp. s54d21]MDY7230631.1 AlkA N-terminal domain-containing protein [Hyalangium sp. s54d21]